MKIQELKNKLKNLVNENTSEEDAKVISDIANELDKTNEELNKIIESAENYRKKYVDLVIHSGFKQEEEQPKDDNPKSLEEIIDAVTSKKGN